MSASVTSFAEYGMRPQPCHHPHPDLDSGLIDVESRRMHTGSDALLHIHYPKPVETTRDPLRIITKILRPHPDLRFQHPVRAEEFPGLRPCHPVQRLVIMNHGITDIDMQ